MQAAQEAANGDSKSSAGDKYETGRAMAHADLDRAAHLWAEADELEAQLAHVAAANPPAAAHYGSVVVLANAVFLLGVGLGKVQEGPPPVFALSMQVPAAKALLGLAAGATAKLPAGPTKVLAVY
jgi:hypothetical protein